MRRSRCDWRVTTGEYVLRGAPHYGWQFPSERFFARLLHERTGAPVPSPYLLEPGDDIFAWSYAVIPRMPGLRPSDRAATEGLTRDDRFGMARAMGENLALLHALGWPRPGRYDLATGTIAPLEDDRKEWVVAEARRWLVLARRHVLAVLRYTTPSSVSERVSFMATTRLPTSRRPI